ncbi:uncharacterized protein LOC142982292 [Anticarsia gemmatalis]|uniref:uncharacterized protein LOC142982292 n=1 Tax=Anticarsia gemmatalis TaxID=129554 RepID=UPI003F7618FF
MFAIFVAATLAGVLFINEAGCSDDPFCQLNNVITYKMKNHKNRPVTEIYSKGTCRIYYGGSGSKKMPSFLRYRRPISRLIADGYNTVGEEIIKSNQKWDRPERGVVETTANLTFEIEGTKDFFEWSLFVKVITKERDHGNDSDGDQS